MSRAVELLVYGTSGSPSLMLPCVYEFNK